MRFFGVNSILQKFCSCKKNDKYQVCRVLQCEEHPSSTKHQKMRFVTKKQRRPSLHINAGDVLAVRHYIALCHPVRFIRALAIVKCTKRAPWQSWSWWRNNDELPSRKALMVPFDSLWSMNTISSLKSKGPFLGTGWYLLIFAKYAFTLTRWSTFDFRIETWARAPHLTERAGDQIRQRRNCKIRRPALQALLVYPGKWFSSGSFMIIMKIRHGCDGLDQPRKEPAWAE